MNEDRYLSALADALDAASAVLRERIAAAPTVDSDSAPTGTDALLERARESVPLLGPRQAEILTLLLPEYPGGCDTGYLSRTMSYKQADVYLTCQKLVSHGLVEKDRESTPHNYRLSPALMEP